MRNSEQYLGLWQQKRNELPISYDVQADWADMQQLLDQNLPVNDPAGNTNAGAQLAHLVRFKLLYAVIALLLAGALTYLIVHHRAATKYKEPVKTGMKHALAKKDIIPPDKLRQDKLQAADSAVATSKNATASGNHLNKINADKTGNSSNNDAPNLKNTAAADDRRAANPGVNSKVLSLNDRLNNSSRLLYNPAPSSTGGFKRLGHVKRPSTSSKSNQRTGERLYNRTAGQPGNSYNLPQRPGRLTAKNTDTRFSADSIQAQEIISPSSTLLTSGWDNSAIGLISKNSDVVNKTLKPATAKSANKKTPSKKQTASTNTGFDWGLLAGVNTSGSFTTKSQNKNIYGSLPVDVYSGLFATYNLSNKWAVNLQTRLLTPHKVSGGYSHTNDSKKDTAQNLQITDSRKVYTADIPLQLVYKVTGILNIKAGPVLTLPLKQVNGVSTFTTKTRKDSTGYYNTVTDAINNTGFDKKVRFGVSAGIGLNYKRLLFEAGYYYGLQRLKISSSLGSYTANTGSLQFTIGIKLNKNKKTGPSLP
ncbi:porin family protein [Mucilaginibacter sp. UR6-11]|uniref:porin family protein n=1 Tax=Mucilaginibacter sp. UR6-11 TaxID=1435644 RepID=UPI001E5F800E|nr:porin family protein [Mucilaginibacter sp. UR6-11]MCC8426460.1 PorT family protein [Mucilaginibacter sp. UR6-11]